MGMFNCRAEPGDARRLKALEAQAAALERATALCEFSMDGQVLRANDNFLKVVGYGEAEFVGRSHASLAGQPAGGPEQRELWARLNRGEHVPGKYRFLAKSGEPRWLRAAFAPVLDASGQPFKVVCFGTDVTQSIAERESLEAERAQAQQ